MIFCNKSSNGFISIFSQNCISRPFSLHLHAVSLVSVRLTFHRAFNLEISFFSIAQLMFCLLHRIELGEKVTPSALQACATEFWMVAEHAALFIVDGPRVRSYFAGINHNSCIITMTCAANVQICVVFSPYAQCRFVCDLHLLFTHSGPEIHHQRIAANQTEMKWNRWKKCRRLSPVCNRREPEWMCKVQNIEFVESLQFSVIGRWRTTNDWLGSKVMTHEFLRIRPWTVLCSSGITWCAQTIVVSNSLTSVFCSLFAKRKKVRRVKWWESGQFIVCSPLYFNRIYTLIAIYSAILPPPPQILYSLSLDNFCLSLELLLLLRPLTPHLYISPHNTQNLFWTSLTILRIYVRNSQNSRQPVRRMVFVSSLPYFFFFCHIFFSFFHCRYNNNNKNNGAAAACSCLVSNDWKHFSISVALRLL